MIKSKLAEKPLIMIFGGDESLRKIRLIWNEEFLWKYFLLQYSFFLKDKEKNNDLLFYSVKF